MTVHLRRCVGAGRWLLFLPLLCAVVLLALPPGHLRLGLAFVLLWVLPGLGWGLALGGRWLVGLGTGAAINLLLALLLVYLPGRVPTGLSLALFTAAALAPGLISLLPRFRARPGVEQRAPRLPVRASYRLLFWGVFAVAALFRLPNLGYSEFQGDEGVIMLRAAMAIEGDEEQLFLHQKGPAEVLVPLATWRLGGVIDEFWARLPFAWLNLVGVMAVVELGSRWFDQRAAWLAGAIVAISGLHVAFARIVQNQSLVFSLGLLALLALDDYGRHAHLRDLLLGSLLLATSVLGHYDAVLVYPAAGLVALGVLPGRRWRLRQRLSWRHWLFALALGIGILALFYGPFVGHPNFEKTLAYLARDRVQAEQGLNLNVEKMWGVSTLYNSTYYYLLLLALVLAAVLTWRRYPAPAAWLLFLVPFGFYLIVVSDPRTHIYTFYPGAALLAGAALSALWARLRRGWARWALLGAGTGVYALCAGYIWILFVDHTPEYLRTFPVHKSPLYWTSYQEIFSQGLFGFPYRAGWHAVGGLYARGEIAGVYASNEEQEITDWYTRQAPRIHCPMPDVYIVAENVQDPIYIDRSEIERDYVLAGTVRVGGQARIRWYIRHENGGPGTVGPLIVDAAAEHQWWRPAEVVPRYEGWSRPVHAVLGERVELLGYDLDEGHAIPGGWVRVTLYWRPLQPLLRNYQVFAHLYDGQKLWAQHDGAPECTINATTRWEPGQMIPDPHLIPLPADVPPGPMPLLVGMYDLLSLERLDVPGGAENAIHLTDVQIRHERE